MADYKIKVGDTSIEAVNPVNEVSPYNLTCNVVRVAYTNTALGCTEVPSNIVTSMSCSIEWKSSSEKDEHKKITHFITGLLRCRVPAGVTIVNTDKIYYNSETYEITNIEDVNNLGVLLVISIRKVK